MQKVKEKSNWKGETIVEIEIERLKAFRNHPFQVRDDDDLEKLKESIKMYGILTPLLVRPIKDGTYEIISGHRRKRAAALLGYRKIPVLIQPMSYEDAVVKMVDTNLHREHISFSEKAFAYRMKNEALKQKVGRKKGQSGQQKKGKKTIEIIGEEFGDSPKQVQRYIAVTRLIPELLQKLDQGEISFNPAVEISALTKEEQRELLEAMNYAQSTPSVSQAQRIKKLSKEETAIHHSCRNLLHRQKDSAMALRIYSRQWIHQTKANFCITRTFKNRKNKSATNDYSSKRKYAREKIRKKSNSIGRQIIEIFSTILFAG